MGLTVIRTLNHANDKNICRLNKYFPSLFAALANELDRKTRNSSYIISKLITSGCVPTSVLLKAQAVLLDEQLSDEGRENLDNLD